jgi:hypothetical protein
MTAFCRADGRLLLLILVRSGSTGGLRAWISFGSAGLHRNVSLRVCLETGLATRDTDRIHQIEITRSGVDSRFGSRESYCRNTPIGRKAMQYRDAMPALLSRPVGLGDAAPKLAAFGDTEKRI